MQSRCSSAALSHRSKLSEETSQNSSARSYSSKMTHMFDGATQKGDRTSTGKNSGYNIRRAFGSKHDPRSKGRSNATSSDNRILNSRITAAK